MALLLSIIEFIGEDRTNAFRQGDQVLKAGHVVLLGCVKKTPDKRYLFGLCLQTSNLSGPPHEINITLDNKEKILDANCSCTAGNSSKCKHIVAVLFKVNSVSLDGLEDLSSTDMKQQWGKARKQGKDLYAPVPLSETCHLSTKTAPLDKDRRPDHFHRLLSACPASEASIIFDKEKVADGARKIFQQVQNRWDAAASLPFQVSQITASLSLNAVNLFNESVALTPEKSLEIFLLTLGQTSSELWTKERSCRITASRAYELMTYSQNSQADWDLKFRNLYRSTFTGNDATRYGQKNEAVARQWYEYSFKVNVQIMGFVICPHAPWFGCSPDGVLSDDVLLEIKCPFSSLNSSLTDYVKNCDFLATTSSGEVNVRRKHKYYGQIQFELGLLCLAKAQLLVYGGSDKSGLVVDVPRDDEFIEDMFRSLNSVYFEFLLPRLAGPAQ